jgi:hypothetical protein
MIHVRRSASWFALCLLPLAAVSCSSGEALYPVQGTVLHKTKPLSGAEVRFHPPSASHDLVDWPAGKTHEDGTFTLSTGGKEGAPAGEYKVTIVCLETPQFTPGKGVDLSTAGREPKDRLHGAYADPGKTRLTASVKAGVNQLEPFQLP